MKAHTILYELKSNWRIWGYLNVYSPFSKRQVRINKYTSNVLDSKSAYIFFTLNYNLYLSTSFWKIATWAKRASMHIAFRLLHFLKGKRVVFIFFYIKINFVMQIVFFVMQMSDFVMQIANKKPTVSLGELF